MWGNIGKTLQIFHLKILKKLQKTFAINVSRFFKEVSIKHEFMLNSFKVLFLCYMRSRV